MTAREVKIMVIWAFIAFVFGVVCFYFVERSRVKKHVKPEITNPVAREKPVISKRPLLERPKIPRPVTAVNRDAWAGTGFELVTKLECAKCDDICWLTKGDKGGVTCVGFAMKSNADLLKDILNTAWHRCKDEGIQYDWTGKHPFGRVKDICFHLRKAYWNRYFKNYAVCDYKAMLYLGDTAVLQGPRSANLILQRSHNIKPDGLFGPVSQSFCQKATFKSQAFLKERERVLRTYKDFPKFGKGWLKRLEILKREVGK